MGIKTRVDIDITQLGVNLELGTTYRLAIEDGFVKEDGGEEQPCPGVSNLVSFTTPLSYAYQTSHTPNGSANTNNQYFEITFDRNIKKGTGNIYLNKFGTPDSVIRTYSVSSSDITITANKVRISTLGSIIADSGYYITFGPTVFTDLYGFPAEAVSSSGALSFSTALSTSGFPDLSAAMSPSFSVYCDATPKYAVRTPAALTSAFTVSPTATVILAVDRWLTTPSVATYIEDTAGVVSGYPQITDIIGSIGDQYVVQVYPTSTTAVKTLSSSGSGGTSVYNSTTKTLVISGTKTQVNSHLSALTLLTSPDYALALTLKYDVYTNSILRVSKTQTFTLTSPMDSEIQGVLSSYSYYGKTSNAFFTNSLISDKDTDPSTTYTITLTTSQTGSGSGSGFASNADGSDFNSTWTYSGTKAEVNAKFDSILYYPGVNANSSTSFVYTQYKSTVGNQRSFTVVLNFVSNSTSSDVYSFLTPGSYTWAPNFIESRYRRFDYLVVGGGGSSPIANLTILSTTVTNGAGGGAVVTSSGATISNSSYDITVGAAGEAGTVYNRNNTVDGWQVGYRGETSSLGLITAAGGRGSEVTVPGSGSALEYWDEINGGYSIDPADGVTTYSRGGGKATDVSMSVSGNGNAGGLGRSGYSRWSPQGASAGGGGGGAGGVGGSVAIFAEHPNPTPLVQNPGAGGAGGAGIISNISGSTVEYGKGGTGTSAYTPYENSGVSRNIGATPSGPGGGGGGGYQTVGPAGRDGCVIIKTRI